MKYKASQLLKKPTLDTGHFDNLKIQTKDTRVWLSRMTKADGALYDNEIRVEKLVNGNWIESEKYKG